MMYVIAGNEQEAYDWINEEIQDRINNNEPPTQISDYQYLHDVTVLEGINNPHGVFVGTWFNRPDIDEVFVQLVTRMNPNSGPYAIVSNLYKEWLNGTYEQTYSM